MQSQPTDPRPPGPGLAQAGWNLEQWRRRGLGFLAQVLETYGDLVRLQIGEYSVYLLNHPSLVKEVLFDHHSDLCKPESIKVSNRGHWGEGLTSLDGGAWRERKRQMRPLFHRREIIRQSQVILECTEDMVARWRPGLEICLYQELVDLRAEIAARIVLGAVLRRGDEKLEKDSLPLGEARGETFILTPENSQLPFWGMRRPRAATRVDEMVRLIRKRLAEASDREDVLSYLSQVRDRDGQTLLPDDMADEVLQMFFAGHLTVPTWLTRLWFVLWARPELEVELVRESCEVFQSTSPTFEDLQGLPWGEQLIRETGRYFAPAPILYREVANAFSVAGYRFEAGNGVWICPQLLHHDPRNFEDPHDFRPGRFAPENIKGISRYAYLPFGAGPRTCIARHSAMAEMQWILAAVCQMYRLVPLDPPTSRELFAMPNPDSWILRVEAR